MIVYSNIFTPRNDWGVKSLQCKRDVLRGLFYIQVAQVIKEVMGQNPLELKGYRGRENALSRQVFCDMMRKYSGDTLMTIGSYLGKGHDTVIHSIKQVKNLTETDRKFRITYNRINMRVKELIPK